MSTDCEISINYSTVTVVTADSHSIADTVDTDCLTVVAVNKWYCRQINWQLLAEQQSECQNAIGRLTQVQKGIFPAQEPNPQTLSIPPPFYKKFQVLFCVRPTFYVSNSMVKNVVLSKGCLITDRGLNLIHAHKTSCPGGSDIDIIVYHSIFLPLLLKVWPSYCPA